MSANVPGSVQLDQHRLGASDVLQSDEREDWRRITTVFAAYRHLGVVHIDILHRDPY